MSKDLSTALKNKDILAIIDCINKIIKNGNSDYIGKLVTEYTVTNNKSLAYTLLSHPDLKSHSELVQRLREMCIEQTSGYNDFLAADLFLSLNSDSKEKTEKLINKITDLNVRNVAFFYDAIGKQTGEVAASKDEKSSLALDYKGWKQAVIRFLKMTRYPDVKCNAKSRETLIQGVVNQESIPFYERCNFLKHVLDCYVNNARNNDIPEGKINAFNKKVFGTGKEDPLDTLYGFIQKSEHHLAGQSTWYIEQELEKLFAND